VRLLDLNLDTLEREGEKEKEDTLLSYRLVSCRLDVIENGWLVGLVGRRKELSLSLVS